MAHSSESHGTINQTPHERAMAGLRDECLELYRKMGRDEMLQQGDPVETLFTFVTRLISDREYVIGWNAGFNFAKGPKALDAANKRIEELEALVEKINARAELAEAQAALGETSRRAAEAENARLREARDPKKIDGAIRGLKRLKADFAMKGSNAQTIERAINLFRATLSEGEAKR